MSGRHFYTRHRGKWFSTVDITKAATKYSGVSLSRSLPIGSEFLDAYNMVQALREMDREPFTYIGVSLEDSTVPVWNNFYHDNPLVACWELINTGFSIELIEAKTFPD